MEVIIGVEKRVHATDLVVPAEEKHIITVKNVWLRKFKQTINKKCEISGFITKEGPGPILENGEELFFSAISVGSFDFVIEPTTRLLIESADWEILLLGAFFSKLKQFPADLHIRTLFSSCISSSAFPKSENSSRWASLLVPSERFHIFT